MTLKDGAACWWRRIWFNNIAWGYFAGRYDSFLPSFMIGL
jgi:hypothetical protein